MRDIIEVLNSVINEIPESEKELLIDLKSVKTSAEYSSPELDIFTDRPKLKE